MAVVVGVELELDLSEVVKIPSPSGSCCVCPRGLPRAGKISRRGANGKALGDQRGGREESLLYP